MKTAIVTDSNCGIAIHEADILNIHIIPMPVLINEKTYYEGKNLMYSDFLQHLIREDHVTTSQPAPSELMMIWDKLLKEQYDEIVYIPMSSGLSSSYQTAYMISQDYAGKVYVVDAHRISVTQRHAVMDAVALREQGFPAARIKEILERNAFRSIIFVGVDDIHYLKRGGRITPAAAAITSVLNIKPLLVIRGEKIDSYAKVRGSRKCQKELLKIIKEKSCDFLAQGQRLRIGITGSFPKQEDTQAWYDTAKQVFSEHTLQYDPLTFSITCHTGPNAFGMGISAYPDELHI